MDEGEDTIAHFICDTGVGERKTHGQPESKKCALTFILSKVRSID